MDPPPSTTVASIEAARTAMHTTPSLDSPSSKPLSRISNTSRRLSPFWPAMPPSASSHDSYTNKESLSSVQTATTAASSSFSQYDVLRKEMDELRRQLEANNTFVRDLQQSLSVAQQRNLSLQSALAESRRATLAPSSHPSNARLDSTPTRLASRADALQSRLEHQILKSAHSASSLNATRRFNGQASLTPDPTYPLAGDAAVFGAARAAMRQNRPGLSDRRTSAAQLRSPASMPVIIQHHILTGGRNDAEPQSMKEVVSIPSVKRPGVKHPSLPPSTLASKPAPLALRPVARPPSPLAPFKEKEFSSDALSPITPGSLPFPSSMTPASPIDYNFPVPPFENISNSLPGTQAEHAITQADIVERACQTRPARPGVVDASCQTQPLSTRSKAVQTGPIMIDSRTPRLPLMARNANATAAPVENDSTSTTDHVPDQDIGQADIIKVLPRRSLEPLAPSSAPAPPKLAAPFQDDRLEAMKTTLSAKYGAKLTTGGSWYNAESSDNQELEHPAFRQQVTPPRSARHTYVPPTPVAEDGGHERPAEDPKHLQALRSVTSLNSFQRSERPYRNYAVGVTNARRPVTLPALSVPQLGDDIESSHNRNARSPSIASYVSSSTISKPGEVHQPPPFAIPKRSSSTRQYKTRSEGRYSPVKRSEASTPLEHRQDTASVLETSIASQPRVARFTEQWSGPNSPQIHRPSDGAAVPDKVTPPNNSNTEAPVQPDNTKLRPQRSEPYIQHAREGAIIPTLSTRPSVIGNSIQYSATEAISAAMAGEWMWKAARKRSLFGGTTSFENKSKSELRHQRWVWLVPLEQTLRWSSKRPVSTAAGKNTREVRVQSVLDVKTPAQSGAFDRCIMVLTEGRATKFTATTRERHYLWLTALSSMNTHSHSGLKPQIPITPAPPSPSIPPVPSVAIPNTAVPLNVAAPVEVSRKSSIRQSLSIFRSNSRTTANQASDTMATPKRNNSALERERKMRFVSPPPKTAIDPASPPTVPRLPTFVAGRPPSTHHSSRRPSFAASTADSVSVLNPDAAAPRSVSRAEAASLHKLHSHTEGEQLSGEPGPVLRDKTEDDAASMTERSKHRKSDTEDEDLGGNSSFFDAVSRQRSAEDMRSRVRPPTVASSGTGIVASLSPTTTSARPSSEHQHLVGVHARTLIGDGVELPPDVPRIQLRRKGHGIFRREEAQAAGDADDTLKDSKGSSEDDKNKGQSVGTGELRGEFQEFF